MAEPRPGQGKHIVAEGYRSSGMGRNRVGPREQAFLGNQAHKRVDAPVATTPVQSSEKPARTRRTNNRNDRRDHNWTPLAILGGGLGAGVLIGGSLLISSWKAGPAPYATDSPEGNGMPSAGNSTEPAKTNAPTVAASKEPVKSPDTFPTTREAVVASLGGNINPDFVMRGYTDGKPNGTWQIEAFPLLEGVHANGNGDFVDADGNVLTDPGKVYKFSAKPQWINSLTLTVPGSYLFARSGGDVPSGQQANRNRFDGTLNSTMTGAFEQAALIPTTDCDPATAAWRDAVSNFTWPGDVQKGIVKVDWFNPETNQLQEIDGRMVTAYAKAGIDIASLIQEMPANFPITPDQAASDTGGTTKAANWTLDIKKGWTYEGFGFASGISYDSKRGVHTDRKGNVITDLAKIFDYSKYDVNSWPTSMHAANIPHTYTFMRAGGASKDQPNTSWYSNDKTGVVLLKDHGIEQAAIILIPPAAGCTSIEVVAKALAQDAIIAARNPDITVKVWSGKEWIVVPSAAAASASLPN